MSVTLIITSKRWLKSLKTGEMTGKGLGVLLNGEQLNGVSEGKWIRSEKDRITYIREGKEERKYPPHVGVKTVSHIDDIWSYISHGLCSSSYLELRTRPPGFSFRPYVKLIMLERVVHDTWFILLPYNRPSIWSDPPSLSRDLYGFNLEFLTYLQLTQFPPFSFSVRSFSLVELLSFHTPSYTPSRLPHDYVRQQRFRIWHSNVYFPLEGPPIWSFLELGTSTIPVWKQN